MKILFIYPNLTRQEYISLGIAYLSSYLKREGHEAYLMDYTFGGNTQDCLDMIEKVKPGIIGFSLRSGEFRFSLRLAEEIKKKFNIPIIFGGVHPTIAPEETISKKPVDMICVGEGELALAELLQKMENGNNYTKTRNFWFKKDKKIIKNSLNPLIQNLDSEPFPDRELFDFARYLDCRNGAVDIFMGRGCPYNCTYCINHILQRLYKNKGMYVRIRSVDNVLEEMRSLTKNYKINYFSFQDDTLGINKEWVKEFAKKYSKEINLPFSCNIRPEVVNEELCKNLKRGGCTTLSIGIESGSEKLRKEVLRRYNSNEKIIRAFKIARKAGLASYSFNMVGLPFETDRDVQKTIRLNQKIKPDFLQASVFQPYPGTDLRRLCEEKGWLTEKDIPISHKTDSILNYPQRTAKEIKRQKQFFRYNVLKKGNLKKALLILAFDLNESLFTKIRDKIPVPLKKTLFSIDASLRTRKVNCTTKTTNMPKIYFRLTNPHGGANTLIDYLIKYLANKNLEYTLDYLPGFPNIMPIFTSLFKNKGLDCNVTHKDVFSSFYKTNIPTLINVYHLVYDPYYKKYQTLPQKIYSQFLRCYEKRAIKNADLVVCLSRYTKKQLENSFGYKKAVVIYGGVDTNHFIPMTVNKEKFGISKNKKVLLFTGNALRRKGADLLPEIMVKLGDDYVLLITSGMRQDRKFNRKNILSLGRVDSQDLPEIYNVADILLFPTRLESFGYSVAEAMACEKPVVTTNCSSLPELIVDGQGGFLCEIDNVNDFVEKIRILAKDEKLRKRMGQFNRKRVLKNFTLEVMGKKYINLYKKLAK